MTRPATRVAVLISGEGTNLQALIDAAQAERLGARIVAVVSNRAGARGLERARAAGIEALHLPAARGQERADYDAALAALLAPHEPDLIVLAGFMRIFGPAFVELYAGRMLNIHPSLLPKYPGLDTHRRVLEAGDRWHGATVHFVTAELDAGPADHSVSACPFGPATRPSRWRSASTSASTSSCPAPCLGSRPVA